MITNMTAYTDLLNQACNSRSVDNVLRFYSPHYVGSDVGEPTLLRGHKGLRATLERYWQAFPDLHFVVTGKVIQASRATIIWMAEGTHQGPIMNIPPTGHTVKVRGVSVIDVQDGLVIRGEYIWDLAGMLRHLGLLPEL